MFAAGYGFGAFLTTLPISAGLAANGLSTTLAQFGVGIGLVGLLAAQGVRMPAQSPGGQSQAPAAEGVGPATMLRQPVFWLMFAMMTMMSTSGLMVISQMGALAKDFGVATVAVFGMAALPLALTVDRVTNGLTRPFFGWVSDRIGRETTMAIAFGLEGLAMLAWLGLRDEPLAFVLMSGVVFFGWGEIFSLFPATLTDTFGARHATTNYGFLYISQGMGSVLGGPIAALIHQQSGSWSPVFYLMASLDLCAALLALFVLRKMRKAYLQRQLSPA
jgi:MFS family permease